MTKGAHYGGPAAGLLPDDNDRARGVVGHLAADRAGHQPGEPAAPPAADHQQIGVLGGADEGAYPELAWESPGGSKSRSGTVTPGRRTRSG